MHQLPDKTRLVFSLIVALLILSTPSLALADGEIGEIAGYPSLRTVEGALNGNVWSGYAGTLEFQFYGGAKSPVFCTDIHHQTGKGVDYVASDEEIDCRVKWLLIHYPPLLKGAAGWNANEMAARQMAVWHFSDGLHPEDTPNGPDTTALALRAWEIIDAVPGEACAVDAPSVAIAPASANNPVGDSQTFTVTVTQGGEPIADQPVDLNSNAGDLSSDTVTTDANGQAVFTMTMGMAGDAQVQASTTLSLPVGAIFNGVDPNKQKLVLGEMVANSVHAQANGVWNADGSITAFSFADYNMNGQPDNGEPAIEGLAVELYQDDSLLATALSGSDGKVTFDGLSGAYTVVQEEQGDWRATGALSQTVDVNDDVQTLYFGQIKLPVITGQVYDDADQDGVWGDDEVGLAGWDLQLFRENGSAVIGMTGKTDAKGKVVFSNDPQRNPPDLTPGVYYVKETLPDGDSWRPTDGLSRTVTVEAGDVKAIAIGNFLVQPALAFSKIGPADAREGDVITYQFTVENTGNVALENITVTDPLLGGEIAACAFDQLDAGEALACEATYQILTGASAPASGALTNTATASGAVQPYLYFCGFYFKH